ncbi:hypothetical protein VB711_02125 [Cronbergia sp. UHCC 0137]|uniref:hypothetical protein n=1 Tax=Cronbergia sp. UHCC 0137 TaxID=3110239 RepID=UPI002B21C274|nr:hypothetical protein [Cronbergia sp. UHCC 0137]MEA5616640.1 hypothetical protein [Cronbergia sp. UHCC 0137]
MKKKAEFPFNHARRISSSEVIAAEQAIQEQFGGIAFLSLWKMECDRASNP